MELNGPFKKFSEGGDHENMTISEILASKIDCIHFTYHVYGHYLTSHTRTCHLCISVILEVKLDDPGVG